MFNKNGEVPVYKAGKKVGAEGSNEEARYTVDDLVKEDDLNDGLAVVTKKDAMVSTEKAEKDNGST